MTTRRIHVFFLQMSLIMPGFLYSGDMYDRHRTKEWWNFLLNHAEFRNCREVMSMKTNWEFSSSLCSPMDFFYQDSSPLLGDYPWKAALTHPFTVVNEADMIETEVLMSTHVQQLPEASVDPDGDVSMNDMNGGDDNTQT